MDGRYREVNAFSELTGIVERAFLLDSGMFSNAEIRYWKAGVINRIDKHKTKPKIPIDVIEIPNSSLITINKPTAITDPGNAYPIVAAV